MNPYYDFVLEYVRLFKEGKNYALGKAEPAPRPQIASDASQALFFAPHPDDECIAGGLALRLMREAGMNVVNVAVTQGSNKDRQAERLKELQAACKYIGFGLVTTGPHGLEKINVRTRQAEPAHWSAAVEVMVEILGKHQPKVVFFPHDHDWNSAHIGTHFLVMDALKKMPAGFECHLVETEFWGQMASPNLMVELSEADLADMVTATTFHVGEVKRNPYHLLLPAWMMDNVRRGAELVGGQGGAAPDFIFAALYRLRKWTGGNVVEVLDSGKLVPRSLNVGQLFP